MKDKVANQLVKYLEGARRRARLRPVRPHQHRRAGRAREEQDQVHQHAARADRRARRRRLRARQEPDGGRALAPGPGPHQRGDRRGQRGARLDADGGDRRRRADPLLRQASAPGSEPARGCLAVRDLPPVRQARLARGPAATCFPEIIEKAFALAESGRPGPVLVDVPMDIFSTEIDVALFERLRPTPRRCTSPRSTRRRRRRSSSACSAGEAPGALRRRRHHAAPTRPPSCASSSTTCRFRSRTR